MWECLQLSVWCFVSEVLLFQLKKQEIYWEVNWPDNTELFMGENYWNLNPEWSNWKLNDDRLCRQHGVVQVWSRLCCCCNGELETWIMVRRLRETIYGEEWQHHQWYMKYRSTNEQLLGLPQWFISTQLKLSFNRLLCRHLPRLSSQDYWALSLQSSDCWFLLVRSWYWKASNHVLVSWWSNPFSDTQQKPSCSW